jgi:hypothetical protein
MSLSTRKDVVLAKLEGTYGTDPTPTGAANAILVSNLQISPLQMTPVERGLIREWFGNSESIPGQIFGEVSFEVEIQGSGTAGTATAYGPLLQACGLVETDGASDVQYDPTSSEALMKSVTIFFYRDGVLHEMNGARGSVSLSFVNQQIPKYRFRFQGQYVRPVDAAPTGVSYTAFKTPAIVNATNTTPFTLHSISPVVASLEIDLANNLVYRDYIGGSKKVLITDRKPTGRIVMEAALMATKNWFQSIETAATGALQVQQGQSAGYIVVVDAPSVQLINPSYSDSDGIAMLEMDLIFNPTTGNNEIKITTK